MKVTVKWFNGTNFEEIVSNESNKKFLTGYQKGMITKAVKDIYAEPTKYKIEITG